MIFVRSLIFHLAFYLWTALVSVVSLPVLLISPQAIRRVSHIWAAVTFFLLRVVVGLSYEVRGRHHLLSPTVIVALKHQSAWDTIALWVLLKDPAIVVKQSLAKIPLFGWYVTRGEAIVINRADGAKALRQMTAKARRAAAERRPIAIFPEGTRTPVGAHQPYQPGVAALYMQLGVPIVPVALNSGLFWSRHSFVIRPGRIIVECLTPIEPGSNRRQAMNILESRIEYSTAMLIDESNGTGGLSNSVRIRPQNVT